MPPPLRAARAAARTAARTAARAGGLLAALALAACSLSADFDRPFVAPDMAPDAAAPDAGNSCTSACEALADCARSLPGCPGARSVPNAELFIGACAATCERSLVVPAITRCDTSVVAPLALCQESTPLCEVLCATGGPLDTSFLYECLQEPVSIRRSMGCTAYCNEVPAIAWRCVGDDQVTRGPAPSCDEEEEEDDAPPMERPECAALPFCDSLERCLPSRMLD